MFPNVSNFIYRALIKIIECFSFFQREFIGLIVGFAVLLTNCEMVELVWLINHTGITTTPIDSVSTAHFYL